MKGKPSTGHHRGKGHIADEHVPENKRLVGHCIAEGCGKPIFGAPYGRFGDGGVCSKACNIKHSNKPKYLPPGSYSRQQATS